MPGVCRIAALPGLKGRSLTISVIFIICVAQPVLTHAEAKNGPSPATSVLVGGYEIETVVDAIFVIEGGSKTRYPFGIRSVPCSGYASCRIICFNTVKNSAIRWERAGCPGTFIDYLASRYAPIGANNDNGTNKFWKRNLLWHLRNPLCKAIP